MDVAVFGGGPAGLASALALRQRGFRVALYDAQRPPIDKACGEGLMPEAVRLLREFGLALDERDGASFAGISFHDAYGSAYARFSGDRALGVRRTHLQKQMARRAAEMGVALHWGAVVQALAGGGFASAGVRIAADFFVIADGLRSTLAPASGFREPRCHSKRYASRQQFQRAPWVDLVEVHWGRREQLYVTPLGRDEIGVALLTSRRGRRVCDALLDFPAVAKRIAGAAPTSKMRGAVTQTCSQRQVIRGNVAVVGDASGSVDALTGEGLLSAFRQSNALAEAMVAGDPMRYEAAHRRMAKTSQCMARILLLLDRHPGLEQRFVTRMAERPENFAALLRMHLAAKSWPGFARSAAATLLFGKRGAETSAENSKTAEAAPGVSSWMPHATKADRERGL
jgi:flavin-dependent dehydrogenase